MKFGRFGSIRTSVSLRILFYRQVVSSSHPRTGVVRVHESTDKVAHRAGIEPAPIVLETNWTPCPAILFKKFCFEFELLKLFFFSLLFLCNMAVLPGFEPGTISLTGSRSTG